jgi:hypothetical protein
VRRSVALVLVTAAALALSAAAVPAADGLTYNGSLGVFTGDYTLSEDTTTVVLFNGLAWSHGRWRVAVDLPLVYQDTPYVSYVGGIPVPTGRRWSQGDSPGPSAVAAASQEGTQTQAGNPGGGSGPGSPQQGGEVVVPDPDTVEFDETGVGDPLLRFDVRLTDAGRASWGLFAGAKAPIADEESGFGTGEWDFGGGVTYGASAGRGRIFGELGYWVYGDIELYELDDPVVATLGYTSPFGDRWSWLVALYGASTAFDEVDGPVEASASLRRAFDRGALSLTLGAGLTETAPDLRLTLGWSSGF